MSFLFKKQKGNAAAASNALPPASRDIRSSDGPASGSGSGPASQIPTLNGVGMPPKPASPTPTSGSVNNSLNSLAGNEQIVRPGQQQQAPASPQQAQQQQEKGQFMGAEGTRMSVAPSPEQKTLRDRSMEAPRQRMSSAPGPGRPSQPQDISPYPWSSRPLAFTTPQNNPFPRYGAAVNATASKDGAIYLMGGLINGTTVKGDLWTVEPSPSGLSCSPVATTSEGPGPRVGHASLLVGNAFIVFGGDTKMEEGDALDDTLYLLNTSTKQWSRALPAGPRPPGRYGHTINILGSKIYIFGGQVEGYFFNDLYAFDLNALQQPQNKWELLVQNTIDGGPPHGQIPPARTNHTMVAFGDKLYLFGGTDGVHWFNDVWTYSPHTNTWTQLECIGYIPSPREGHAAALVGDVMYIFGGRTEEGTDLGDLAAFRITSRRWYTFQNMGPSPSPRSGHSMTTLGKQIVVLAGEPSSAPRDVVELSHAYFLDTSKIRYPPDANAPQGAAQQQQQNMMMAGGQQQQQQTRRPSADRSGLPLARPPQGIVDREQQLVAKSDSQRGMRPESRLPQSTARSQQQQQPFAAPAGAQPPATSLQQSRSNPSLVAARQPTRPMSPNSIEAERAQNFERNASSPQRNQNQIGSAMRAIPGQSGIGESVVAPPTYQGGTYYDDGGDSGAEQLARAAGAAGGLVETYRPSQDEDPYLAPSSPSRAQMARDQRQPPLEEEDEEEDEDEGEDDSEGGPEQESQEEPEESLPKVRGLQQQQQQQDRPQDSGIGSSPSLSQQYDDLIRQLEQAKQRNAWYASELALARKSGYQSSRSMADSPVLDERSAPDVFSEDDKPLVQALLQMRAELARVQQAIDEQSRSAAERIAEMQKQRDAAISEAVYAKTRLAGQGSPALDNGDGAGAAGGKRSPDQERSNDMSRRLASSLAAQSELTRRVDGLIHEIEAEKKAREFAEETAEAAQKRVAELDGHRQQNSSDLEGLRAELHESQSHARDISASHAQIKSQHDMLAIDKEELTGRLDSALAQTQNHATILTTLHDALSSSTAKADMLQQRLDEERGNRDGLESQLRQLRSEHEERSVELESTSRRLRDAESMAEKHADEARTHREAVLAGLGKVTQRDVEATQTNDSRVTTLQAQVEEANTLVRQNQAAADAASAKLRSAEERIAGLEAFQEQASREGLSIRKQLQSALRDNQGLSNQKTELEQKLQSQMLETNALAVQHASLKDILGERGINAAEIRRSRAMDSPVSNLSRFSTPDLQRMRDLEQQLEASLRSHDDMKAQYEEVSERDEKMKGEYENQLEALRNDHQAAVKYLRGTEKMLSKMKQELQRVKTENSELRRRVEESAEANPDSTSRGVSAEDSGSGDWEVERTRLRSELADSQSHLNTQISSFESRLGALQTQLQSTEAELSTSRTAHATSQSDLEVLQTSHAASRSDVDRLNRDNAALEERVRVAENQVQMLLDQVETSVDNYRRQSRLNDGTMNVATMNGVFRHSRSLSNLSGTSGAPAGLEGNAPTSGVPGHARHISDGGNSIHSLSGNGGVPGAGAGVGGGVVDDGRNSLALDSLASELETLRSHWESTNKNYRLSSEKFDFERSSSTARAGPNAGVTTGGPAVGGFGSDGAAVAAAAGGLPGGSLDTGARESAQSVTSVSEIIPQTESGIGMPPASQPPFEEDVATPTQERHKISNATAASPATAGEEGHLEGGVL